VKGWTLPICTGCGGILGYKLDGGCTCDPSHAKTGKNVEVIPADSPNVLSEEEALLLDRANREPEPSSPEELQAFTALLDRLTNWAEGSTDA